MVDQGYIFNEWIDNVDKYIYIFIQRFAVGYTYFIVLKIRNNFIKEICELLGLGGEWDLLGVRGLN